MDEGKAVDATYIISKFPLVPSTSHLPGCTDFNTLLHGISSLKKSKLAYLRVIDANPTDMSTVNTILNFDYHYHYHSDQHNMCNFGYFLVVIRISLFCS